MEQIAASVEEACRALSIGKTKAFELLKSGELESVKLGTRRLVKVSSIHRLLEQVPS